MLISTEVPNLKKEHNLVHRDDQNAEVTYLDIPVEMIGSFCTVLRAAHDYEVARLESWKDSRENTTDHELVRKVLGGEDVQE